MRGAFLVLAATVGAAPIVGIGERDAMACSYPPQPLFGITRAVVRDSKAAFIGTLLSQDPPEVRLKRVVGPARAPGAPDVGVPVAYEKVKVAFRYRVDRVVKGTVPQEVTLEETYGGSITTCGFPALPEVVVGERSGVILHARGSGEDRFSTVGPAVLEHAAKPLPLRGHPQAGRPALVMAGDIPPKASLMSIDGKGRVVAYGSGGSVEAVSICPGNRRLVTLEHQTANRSSRPPALVVRAVDGLRPLRTQRFPVRRVLSAEISCRSESGDDVVVVHGKSDEELRKNHLVRVRNGATTNIFSGPRGPVSFARTTEVAYLAAGAEVTRVDLATGAADRVVDLRAEADGIALSPDEKLLASVATGTSKQTVLFLTDLASRRTSSAQIGEVKARVTRRPVWLDNNEVAVPVEKHGKLYDRRLRFVRVLPTLSQSSESAVLDEALVTVADLPERGFTVAASAVGRTRILASYGDDYYIRDVAAISDRHRGVGAAGLVAQIAPAFGLLALATTTARILRARRRAASARRMEA